VIATTAAIVIGFFTAQEPTPEQIARGETRYARELEVCLDGGFTDEVPPEYSSVEEMCATYVRPEDYQPSRLLLADLPNVLTNVSSILILVGAVLGTTLGGADWSANTMTTLLAWEPRRLRVLGARTVAVAVVVLVVVTLGMALIALEFAALVALRGSFDPLPAGFTADVVTEILRIAGVAALFALIGMSLATIGRSTVAGLGILLGYLVVIEGALAGFVFWVQKITLVRSSLAIVTDTPMQLYDESSDGEITYLLTPGRAWITLGAWVLVLLVVAGGTFRARDVT
jgi:ABC-2 type transport system permease protein